MRERIVIERRFRGPPVSGHGGYVAGIVAEVITRSIGGDAEVTLRKPIPLDTPLWVTSADDGSIMILDGDICVAEARTVDGQINAPAPPTLKEAEDAAARVAGFAPTPFPQCFGCGHDRSVGDGLRTFVGALDGDGMHAGTWTPDPAFCGADGTVRDAFLWAALDCPSGWAVMDSQGPDILLGRMSAKINGNPPHGEPCIVAAWPVTSEGRKRHSGSAIYAADGRLWAAARATWITL